MDGVLNECAQLRTQQVGVLFQRATVPRLYQRGAIG